MVAVAHPDPPEEAQNQTQQSGVPQRRVHGPQARSPSTHNVLGMSFDVDPDEQYRDAHDTREPLFFSSHVGL